ncbi:MAG TPA: hypothetical protein VG248_17620 [Caulobacteraceae bacterium]|jgi:hypothetical protein|nr:hypothetical protein [Caulobacteraceae bacterium]
MASRLSGLAVGVATALLSLAGVARAEAPQGGQLLLAANDFASPIPSTQGRTLEWNPRKGRWGVRLGVDQHIDRATDWRDLEPGVFYKITPRLHIGGGVTLAPDPLVSAQTQRLLGPQPPNPRVRLETTFKF